jgi:hypothetical protein
MPPATLIRGGHGPTRHVAEGRCQPHRQHRSVSAHERDEIAAQFLNMPGGAGILATLLILFVGGVVVGTLVRLIWPVAGQYR